MWNQKKIMKVLDKEIISMAELRELMNNELITEVRSMRSDNKHKDLPKFDVRLENGDMYFVYLKRYYF